MKSQLILLDDLFYRGTGAKGATGATGPSFNTYTQATNSTSNVITASAPIVFNFAKSSSLIIYDTTTGIFTLPVVGTYLINWSASIQNQGTAAVLSLGIYQTTPSASIISATNSGASIAANTGISMS